jgi:hypothetical protein
MTLVPDPVPLDAPAGRPDAVAEAAHDAAAAAHLLDELAERLTGARPPAWHGADAEAADARRSRIARFADDAAPALQRAALRLRGHADVLAQVSARIEALRVAQEQEFAETRPRIAVPLDPADPFAPDPATVLARLGDHEAARAAEHRALMARLADDTAETVRVLSGSAAVVSGTPRYDSDAAVLRLAALLPAWGEPQLAGLGREMALRFYAAGPEERDAVAAEGLDLAGRPAYAAAFLAALGPEKVPDLLAAIWSGAESRGESALLLGAALSALDRDTDGPPWLATLLDDARDAGTAALVTGGLAAVLARARVDGLAGPPPALAADWARSMIAEERATGWPPSTGSRPADADPATSDPLALVVEALVEQHAAVEAARIMTADAWRVVLTHSWNDGGTLRDGLVATVADAPNEAARPALRNALVALGTGLERGNPATWPFEASVVKTALPGLSAALVRHLDVLTAPLGGSAAGSLDIVSAGALRGLGVLAELGGCAAETIEAALATPRPAALGTSDGGIRLVAVSVPAAFVAVRQYGARMGHAMDQQDRKDEAEGRSFVWDWTIGIPFRLLAFAPVAGRVAGALEVVVRGAVRMDGTFENTPDTHHHYSAGEAVDSRPAPSGPRDRMGEAAAREAATLAFARTIGILGEPQVPRAPDEPLLGEVAKALVGDAVSGGIGRALRAKPLTDAVVGEFVGQVGSRAW